MSAVVVIDASVAEFITSYETIDQSLVEKTRSKVASLNRVVSVVHPGHCCHFLRHCLFKCLSNQLYRKDHEASADYLDKCVDECRMLWADIRIEGSLVRRTRIAETDTPILI